MNLKLFFVSLVGLFLAPLIGASDVCSLPVASGPCRAKIPKFYFDSAEGRCQLFFYTGCGANENNFDTLKECHESCGGGESAVKHLKGDHCLLPHTQGLMQCRGAFPKFTFNSRSLSCERILYGGCGGSQNLFSSWEECTSSCVHQRITRRLMSNRGQASPAMGSSSSGNILYIANTNATSVCELPPIEPGVIACKAFMKKWTFDARQAKCVEYIYGGCRGTKNLFDTQEACEARCPDKAMEKKTLSARPSLCSLPTIEGPISCRAYLPRYTFSESAGVCKSFIYGGCGATENVFATKDSCMKTCDEDRWNERVKKTLDVCTQPIIVGNCRARMQKFAYNQESRRCQLFSYGGCGGNENRFDTVEQCVNTCGGEEPSVENLCNKIQCDPKESLLYKAKGCTPMLKPGECCPSEWDCAAWEERLTRKDECFLASKDFPTGKYYAGGDIVEEAKDTCEVGCFCSTRGNEPRILCAVMDCPMPVSHKNKSCMKLYSSVNDCCPSDIVCEGDEEEAETTPAEPVVTCSFNNQTVVEGQTFYPESENPCRRCLCGQGWDGERAEELCHDAHCFTQADDKMKRGCQPIYHPKGCCPIDWLCPPTEKEVKEEVTEKPEEELAHPNIFVRITSNEHPASDVCLLPRPESNLVETEVITQFTFDTEDRICKPFDYYENQIGAGQNLFPSMKSCVQTCEKYIVPTSLTGPIDCEDASEEDESTPAKSDRCLPSRRFRFNKATGKCQDFVQLGCAGNQNSFSSLDECEVRCSSGAQPVEDENTFQIEIQWEGKNAECSLPAEPGMCRARIKRFFFDKQSGICKQFWFGGCKGNGNNFKEETECIARCVPEEKIARALEGQTLDLSGTAACFQKIEAGPCRAKSPKFYFDSQTSTCKMFFYGGCEGNENRFDSLKECESSCSTDQTAAAAEVAFCAQPQVIGNCRAAFPRWNYDAASGRCQRFLFSGCDGNQNNFESKDECLLQCSLVLAYRKKAAEVQPLEDQFPLDSGVCLLDQSKGNCRARFRKFYFNKETKACEPFYYSGCQANANNFGSLDECRSRCSSLLETPSSASLASNSDAVRHPICFLSPEVGECRAQRPMWYFDSRSRKCQRFFWGGCRGNLNRFRTQAECLTRCGDSPTEAYEKEQAAMKGIPEELAAEALENHILVRPTQPTCSMNNETYHRGDIVRFPHDQCKVCVCAIPPSLTCGVAPCPAIGFVPKPGKICTPVMDRHGCCQVGLKCVDPEPSQVVKLCASRPCPALGFIPQAGAICRPRMDAEGCCQIGLDCVSTEPPQSMTDVCARRACVLRAFPTPEGEICEPVMDPEGCCQVGVSCVSANPPSAPEPETCAGRPCPALAFILQKGKICSPKMDSDACCQVGLDCQSEERPAENEAPCSRRPCPLIGFIPQEGKICSKVMDPDGCCQIGLKCEDPCHRRPCPLIGFLPQPGKTCTKVMTTDGCCQVGLECV